MLHEHAYACVYSYLALYRHRHSLQLNGLSFNMLNFPELEHLWLLILRMQL
uniref:Uncharacterized protein n=1 Tax=Arundo donax TaxID=35708 RepID=A0A0A9BS21_ARUDO